MTEYYKVKISVNQLEQLKKDKTFCTLLALSRGMNALLFSSSPMLCAEHHKKRLPMPLAINTFIFNTSIIIEIINTITKNHKYLENLKSYKIYTKVIETAENIKNFRNHYKKHMRNKFAFHFDRTALGYETYIVAAKKAKHKECIIVSGEGPGMRSPYFDLSDVLYLEHVIPHKEKETDEQHDQQVKAQIEQVSKITNEFIKILYELLSEGFHELGLEAEPIKSDTKIAPTWLIK